MGLISKLAGPLGWVTGVPLWVWACAALALYGAVQRVQVLHYKGEIAKIEANAAAEIQKRAAEAAARVTALEGVVNEQRTQLAADEARSRDLDAQLRRLRSHAAELSSLAAKAAAAGRSAPAAALGAAYDACVAEYRALGQDHQRSYRAGTGCERAYDSQR